MQPSLIVALVLSFISLAAWLYLLLARGRFWCTDQELDASDPGITQPVTTWPYIAVVVPARNEADMLPLTLPSLLAQTYPGRYKVFLLDDASSDNTGAIAAGLASKHGCSDRLVVCKGTPLPEGWKGKVWAMEQGLEHAMQTRPEYVLLTDADIAHAPGILQALVLKARQDRLDLVSLMAILRVESFWDRLLIPAFVYFFSKLYPFRWVNDPKRKIAGAAGGCILVKTEALERAGGMHGIRNAIIDDCALGKAVKRSGGRIWLGMTGSVHSMRPYRDLSSTWGMVARTGFDQLGYSYLVLSGTIIGMMLVYIIPPVAAIAGLVMLASGVNATLSGILLVIGACTWAIMAGSYLPMLRRYKVAKVFVFLLPLSAMLYTMMTIASAVRYWRGRGGSWKGRTYGVISRQTGETSCQS